MLIVSMSVRFILGCLIIRDFLMELGYMLGNLDLCWGCIIPLLKERFISANQTRYESFPVMCT